MTNAQLKAHIVKIHLSWILAGVFAVIAVICIVVSILSANFYYERWLNPAEGNDQMQIQSLKRAIAFRPGEEEGYHKILDVYTKDGVMTQQEDEEFRLLLNEYQERLNRTPEIAEKLYRRLAFCYVSCYEGSAEERLLKAYTHFERTSGAATSDLEGAAIDTYLGIANYYTQYVWKEGSLQQPTKMEVELLIKRLSAQMDAFYAEGREDSLAFACCVAALLDAHGELWVSKTNTQTVAALANKASQQLQTDVFSPVANRLRAELTQWTNQPHPWEVS